MEMIQAKDAALWVNNDTKEVVVRPHNWAPDDGFQCEPWCAITDAVNMEWHKASDTGRCLMTLTALDSESRGFSLRDVMRAFVVVPPFRAHILRIDESYDEMLAHLAAARQAALNQLQ
jgi:hypothetical protein